MIVKIISYKNGLYLYKNHDEIMKKSILSEVQVIEHDTFYYKTVNTNVILLIHKSDALEIVQKNKMK